MHREETAGWLGAYGGLERLCIGEQLLGGGRGLALDAVAAEGRGGLRGQADVAHHVDPGVNHRLDLRDDAAPALELDGVPVITKHNNLSKEAETSQATWRVACTYMFASFTKATELRIASSGVRYAPNGRSPTLKQFSKTRPSR
jgi:hypothetical protein